MFRAEYYDSKNKKVIYPLDEELGLLGVKYDLPFVDNICHLISFLPYRQVTDFYNRYFKISPSETLLKQIVENIGNKIMESETASGAFKVSKPINNTKKSVKTVVSIDGGRCKLKKVKWKEVKMGVIYEHSEEKSFNKYYFGHVDMTSDKFGEFSKYHFKNYSPQNQELIFLSDGMPYNWEIKNTYYPEAVEILDFYHACEHLSSFLKQRFVEGSDDFKQWYKKMKGQLYEGELKKFIYQLNHFLISIISRDKLKTAKRELKYFVKNYHRIDYKKYRDNDYPIGSGVMEGGIKQTVNQRLKSSEKTWTPRGANQVLKIKLGVINNNISDVIYKAA